jgi:hypothetical protein
MNDLLEEKIVTTRKPHRCFACWRLFPKGSKLQWSKHCDNGDFVECYTCETCQEILKIAWKTLADPWDNEVGERCVSDEYIDRGLKSPEALLAELKRGENG